MLTMQMLGQLHELNELLTGFLMQLQLLPKMLMQPQV
jgi:hypothetical protein